MSTTGITLPTPHRKSTQATTEKNTKPIIPTVMSKT